ncbi:MAG: hypothetical protein ACYCT9_11770 [Leptospirillum sp.]
MRSVTIADWLKLASQLEMVKVDTWRFEHGSLYCGATDDMITSDSLHFTTYSTALTRFIYVTIALEETYRFVDRHYKILAKNKKIPDKEKTRSCSIRAAILVDSISEEFWPKHLSHLAENYKLRFARYRSKHKSELSGMEFSEESAPGYALHLIRNLRNHVSHGAFPIISNPDYHWSDEEDLNNLLLLLNHSCRMSAIYIQILIERFNEGFNGHEYQSCADSYGPEFEYFIEHCTIDYIRSLHLKGKFSISDAFDYSSRPWDHSSSG